LSTATSLGDARHEPARCLPALQAGTEQAYANNGYRAIYQVDMADPTGSRVVTQAVAREGMR
jgi:hypothetical protein